MKRRLISVLLATVMLLGLLSACGQKSDADDTGNDNQTAETGEPVYGGELHATINSDPTTLDNMMAGSEPEQIPSFHIYETALSSDASGDIWPGVCNYTFEDGVLTLTVRDGVTFHDGSACTINDVYASLQRWMANVKAGQKQIGDKADSIEVSGDSLVLTFSKPVPLALQTIAAYDQGLVILPAAICEKYPDSAITDEADLIGTGPYKFVEHQADRYVLLERYDGYVPTENTDATGMAAPKMAYCDKLYFHPVNDKTTRITGVQTGEYDIGVGVPSNMIEAIKSDANLNLTYADLGIFAALIFNNQTGPCTDKNLRNAILACLDMDELMLAAQGDASLYRLNPCYMMTTSRWFVDESLGKYNNVDLDAAKKYLEASSYNGETLTFITTKDNDYFYKTAIVVAQMVEQIGIKMDVQVYDNPTLKQYRNDPTKFDLFSAGMSAKDDPSQIAFMDETWAGFWSNSDKDTLLATMSETDDYDTRYAAWVEMSKLIYEEVPNITFGERISPIVSRSNVHDLFTTTQKYYWNTWKDAE